MTLNTEERDQETPDRRIPDPDKSSTDEPGALPRSGQRFRAMRLLRHIERRKHFLASAVSLAILLAAATLVWSWAGYLSASRRNPPSVILVPLDSRPVNTDLPRQLAAIAGIDIALPKGELLDQFLTPSGSGKLFTWLAEQNESGYDITILCLNELIFGGLLNSRESAQYVNTSQKLQEMTDYLLRRNRVSSNKLILVYILPRLLPSQYDEAMWKYETELPELSQLKHKQSLDTGDAGIAERIKALETIITREISARYEMVYTEAYNVGISLLNWLDKGLADEVVVGLDDSAEFGLNVMAFNDLKALASQRSQEYAYFLHGADELTPLIVARHALNYTGGADSFSLRYLSDDQEETILPYEAMPLTENFAEKSAYLDDRRPGKKADGASYPSMSKYIYVFTDRESTIQQMDSIWNGLRSDKERSSGALTGLADVAKVNGAWAPLIESAGPDRVYEYVDAYAGWNTAGNSLGSVMAHLLFWEAAQRLAVRERKEAAVRHENLQKIRIIDDYFFQSMIRQELIGWTVMEGYDYLSFGGRWMDAADKLGEMMAQALTPWPKLSAPAIPAGGGETGRWGFGFPWPRSFEIRITIQGE